MIYITISREKYSLIAIRTTSCPVISATVAIAVEEIKRLTLKLMLNTSTRKYSL